MAEFVLSPQRVPHQIDWTLIDYSGAQQSPLSGAVRTVSRGQRWQAHVQFHDLADDDRAYLHAFMASVRGKANRVWLEDAGYVQRGSFPAPELLSNNYLAAGAANWSVNGAATFQANNRSLLYRASGGSNSQLQQPVTLTPGIAYALRACINDGYQSTAVSAGVFMNDGTSQYINSGLSRGLITVGALIGASGGPQPQNALAITAGSVAGALFQVTYTSLRRCALTINPSAQTYFTAMPVDALPVSTNGLLRAGDRFEVNGEFKTVTFDLNSDSSGNGILMFEPALRKTVPDNSPIHIGEPMMRGILTNNAMQTTRPGLLSDYDFTFSEF